MIVSHAHTRTRTHTPTSPYLSLSLSPCINKNFIHLNFTSFIIQLTRLVLWALFFSVARIKSVKLSHEKSDFDHTRLRARTLLQNPCMARRQHIYFALTITEYDKLYINRLVLAYYHVAISTAPTHPPKNSIQTGFSAFLATCSHFFLPILLNNNKKLHWRYNAHKIHCNQFSKWSCDTTANIHT